MQNDDKTVWVNECYTFFSVRLGDNSIDTMKYNALHPAHSIHSDYYCFHFPSLSWLIQTVPKTNSKQKKTERINTDIEKEMV